MWEIVGATAPHLRRSQLSSARNDPSENQNGVSLTDRQARELAYHRERAQQHAEVANQGLKFDVVSSPQRRWWNPYWKVYSLIRNWDLSGKRALVVGCGFGKDAIRLTRLGMDVYAFDLSPESLGIAEARAAKFADGPIHFEQMPAETLSYPNESFDLIFAVDIMHHVDIPVALREFRRVAKAGCIFVCSELYTHSWLKSLRESPLVNRHLYPALAKWVCDGAELYITQDERKLTEQDVALLASALVRPQADWFNAVVNRLLPDRITAAAMCDRVLMKMAKPLGRFLAGRVILWGEVRRPEVASADVGYREAAA